MEKIEEWFKTKKYPHIGNPLKIKDYQRVRLYVENPDNIKKHSFLPFIHKAIVTRKFRADKQNLSKNPSKKRKRKKDKPKVRDTYFASHLDAMVFSKYNYILSNAYEQFIKRLPFNESVVAYRKIPIEIGKKGNKCNIDFAKSAFEFISTNQDKKLSVIVADVTSFFDNLNHKILKRQWTAVINETTLPPDHYNVFKALTRIKYVESQDLFEAYDKTMIVERGVPNSSTQKVHVRKNMNGIRYSKEKKAVAYCKKEEFLKNNLKLVISLNNKTGIPQGSPISATLANIYMIDFDKLIFDAIKNINGFYQRYSDDLIIICEQKYESDIMKLLRVTIKSDITKLEIQPNKTKLYRFEIVNKLFKGFQVNEDTKEIYLNSPLEYLGFTYDGQRVLIKTSGFSKFYRSMKGAFNRSASFALRSKNPDKSIFKSRLYNRFTHKGADRKMKYRPLPDNPKLYEKTKEYNWGNYLSYVNNTNEKMSSLNGNDAIKRQSRKSWAKFNKLMKIHESRLKVKLIKLNSRVLRSLMAKK
ncbi:hypothetical protein CMU89_15180 [Elizabethkingia anophelis]|uniref:reverse transcriptase domain-containing protein n=1 Tax=Elizabethkingia anophelis TaxID=1117645 RepID=UPI00136C0A64|nr:reverse transcriptase domain-containing protein [Elizabethkingia anophelis]MDV3508786.1 hypothetical protein [Elizabethkingia anophelis]MDV3543986.1 hypothetical protein [Elizabethkingia anophelis]MYY25677.1 hypothetical protein [Elizabethkingia anophelis]